MKKILFALLIAALFVPPAAIAADFLSAKPMFLMKVSFGAGDRAPDALKGIFELPEIRQALDETFLEFVKRTGVNPFSDITEIGGAVLEGLDENAREPNNLLFYIKGKFDGDKFMGELEKEEFAKGIIKTEGKLKCLAEGPFMASFIDRGTFVASTADVMKTLAAGGAPVKLEGDAKKYYESSAAFAIFNSGEKLRALIEKAPPRAIPPQAKAALERLENAMAYFDKAMVLEASFADESSGVELKKAVEALKGMAELALSVKERELGDKFSSGTLKDLFKSDYVNKRAGINFARQMLSALTIELSGKKAVAKIAMPEGTAELFKSDNTAGPVMAIAAAGIIAAIAVPNFVKARNKARQARERMNEKSGEPENEMKKLNDGK